MGGLPGHACHDTNRSASFKRRGRCELAYRKCSSVFRVPARLAAMIRIDSIWLATEPMDMRAGTDTALARVVAVFGAAKPHCAYLFANRRATRMTVLVHDGFGVWLAARRLNQGRFHWPGIRHGSEIELDAEQLEAETLHGRLQQFLEFQCFTGHCHDADSSRRVISANKKGPDGPFPVLPSSGARSKTALRTSPANGLGHLRQTGSGGRI